MLPFLLAAVTYVLPPVLMYHRVDVEVPRSAVSLDLTITPATLAAQLRYLEEHGLRAVSFAEYERQVRAQASTAREVILTFDDGYADQYYYAYPILLESHAEATFYIVTGEIGKLNHVTWSDLRAMRGGGMDIAAHGMTHGDLALMAPAAQAHEIDGSITQLERGLPEAAVSSYAYPSGQFNEATLRVEREAGVPIAVTTDKRYVIPPASSLEAARIRVRRAWTMGNFAAAVAMALAHPQVLPP